VGGQGTKQRQNLYINFPHLLHICRQKNKCDPFVLVSGSAKSSLGWQFLTFPIGAASSKRHVGPNTRLEGCVAAIWQPGFFANTKACPSWLVILTNELRSTKHRLTMYMMTMKPGMKTRKKTAFSLQRHCYWLTMCFL